MSRSLPVAAVAAVLSFPVLGVVGCAPRPSAGSASVAIPSVMIEPVYRAAKTVQGATHSGVTYVKFGELLQGFSTELAIAKDHVLTAGDAKVIALYDDAFACYEASAELWKDKLALAANGQSREHAALIIAMERPDGTMVELPRARIAATYNLPVTDGVLGTYRDKTIPEDSAQRLWTTADALILRATNRYYGRESVP